MLKEPVQGKYLRNLRIEMASKGIIARVLAKNQIRENRWEINCTDDKDYYG
jgi:hypothetical protein